MIGWPARFNLLDMEIGTGILVLLLALAVSPLSSPWRVSAVVRWRILFIVGLWATTRARALSTHKVGSATAVAAARGEFLLNPHPQRSKVCVSKKPHL